MKFKTSELLPGEAYAVMAWQGRWHVIKIEKIGELAQDLTVRWLACSFAEQSIAEHVRDNYAHLAQKRAAHEAAGLCSCGRPYEEH